MNPFLSFIIRMAAVIPSAITIWMVSLFALNNTFLVSSGLSLAGAAIIYWLLTFYTDSRFLKKNGLTRKEYRYIKKNLDEAKRKIARLHKSLISIRHLPSLKERMELLRVIRKIYHLTKREPRRFYQAEKFYFSHLDSILELTEKYAFLSTQPKRNRELDWSLAETRSTLSEMSKLVEKDLYLVLEDDIDNLNFEIDVAKYSIKSVEETKRETAGVNKPPGDASIPVSQKNSNKDTEDGPKYFINTKASEKEAMKIPLKPKEESRYQDEGRRFK